MSDTPTTPAVPMLVDKPRNITEKGEAAPEPKARKEPPVKVPSASPRSTGGPTRRNREVQVMLSDLGLYQGAFDGYYTTNVRNGVSALQSRLRDDGVYKGVPHGTFDVATRDALLASSIPTTE